MLYSAARVGTLHVSERIVNSTISISANQLFSIISPQRSAGLLNSGVYSLDKHKYHLLNLDQRHFFSTLVQWKPGTNRYIYLKHKRIHHENHSRSMGKARNPIDTSCNGFILLTCTGFEYNHRYYHIWCISHLFDINSIFHRRIVWKFKHLFRPHYIHRYRCSNFTPWSYYGNIPTEVECKQPINSDCAPNRKCNHCCLLTTAYGNCAEGNIGKSLTTTDEKEENTTSHTTRSRSRKTCGREDLNFQGHLISHSDLNAACLPIPPRPQVTLEFYYQNTDYSTNSIFSDIQKQHTKLLDLKDRNHLKISAINQVRHRMEFT